MATQPTVSQISERGSAISFDLVKMRKVCGEVIRRFIDIVISLIVLIVTLPIMLLVVILIRLDSPGPALFWQKRVGRDFRNRRDSCPDGVKNQRKCDLGGRLFDFVKFRTMYADSPKRFPDMYKYEYSEYELRNLQFKMENDPRHTRIGRWLRKTSLDELPNFWNCLVGSMTLVGPRPDILAMTRFLRPEEKQIFDVKPGITGFAQVSGRCKLKFRVTKRLDLLYVKRRSFWIDFKILLQTIICVITSRGAF